MEGEERPWQRKARRSSFEDCPAKLREEGGREMLTILST